MKPIKKEELVQRCREWLRRRRGVSWVVLVIALGVVLMTWPSGGGETESAQEAEILSGAEADPTAQLEAKLECALSQIAGVGEAKVVLTLKSSGKQVYATEVEESQGDGTAARQETVARISTGSSTQEALQVEEEYPIYQGALVVCDGGGTAEVQLAVTESVAALTGLTSDHITVRGRSS